MMIHLLFYAICMAMLCRASDGNTSKLWRKQNDGSVVYDGPNEISDVRRRTEAAKMSAANGFVGALAGLTYFPYTLTKAGFRGGASSAGSAGKAAKEGKIVKAIGHATCVPTRPLLGVASGCLSIASTPFAALGGSALATYQMAKLGVDKLTRSVVKQTPEKRSKRGQGNVRALLAHKKNHETIEKGLLHTYNAAHKILDGRQTSLEVVYPANARTRQ